MGGLSLEKDLLFAVLVAMAIHIGVAFAQIFTVQPAFLIKKDYNRSLEISFVSTYREVKKETPIAPVIKKKRKPIVKKESIIKEKAITKKSINKEDIVSKNVEVEAEKQVVAQPLSQTVVKPLFGEEKSSEAVAIFSAVPRYEKNFPPAYPSIARRRGYQGGVMLSVKVLTNGTAGDLIIKKSSGHSILDRAALKAVKQWKFKPASRMGVPIIMWVDVPVRFILEESD